MPTLRTTPMAHVTTPFTDATRTTVRNCSSFTDRVASDRLAGSFEERAMLITSKCRTQSSNTRS